MGAETGMRICRGGVIARTKRMIILIFVNYMIMLEIISIQRMPDRSLRGIEQRMVRQDKKQRSASSDIHRQSQYC